MNRSRYSRRRNNSVAPSSGEFVWLVSLSDLMMLLFVFFVVLFSFSYKKWDMRDFARAGQIIRGEQPETTPLDEVQAKLLKWVVNRNLLSSVEIVQKQDSLILQIKERLLFAEGQYRLNDDGESLVNLISSAIEKIPAPYRIGIEGHTDDTPLEGKDVYDNWELSTLRAHSVLLALKLPPELLKRTVIMGYGEMDPLLPNRDEHGNAISPNQASNRRVTIRIF
jgi:chemotaxis protein MotB